MRDRDAEKWGYGPTYCREVASIVIGIFLQFTLVVGAILAMPIVLGNKKFSIIKTLKTAYRSFGWSYNRFGDSQTWKNHPAEKEKRMCLQCFKFQDQYARKMRKEEPLLEYMTQNIREVIKDLASRPPEEKVAEVQKQAVRAFFKDRAGITTHDSSQKPTDALFYIIIKI
ncbi:hypothetical protein CRE_30249 [Caenorhabditis remanei]|uniref:Uncharacterized protein n=1 Tax=Caenorhabditis remanei TaxID=31234 RepID=E3NKN5_CAERE|nr:hypothetical protein CRE_30249 [Caenorhabditis remanei]